MHINVVRGTAFLFMYFTPNHFARQGVRGDGMDIREVINKRMSIRLYENRKVDPELLEQVLCAGNYSQALIPSIKTRFILKENLHGLHRRLSGYVGYLGNIMEAPNYIFGLSEKREGYLENMGYVMEQMILKANELGLGTCWISVLKHEDRIADVLGVAGTGERIVALTPVGYEKESRTEKFFNEIIYKEPKKKAVKKGIHEFVYTRRLGQPIGHLVLDKPKLMEVFRYVAKAPSWANEQPWAFIVNPKEVVFAVRRAQGIFEPSEINHYRIDGGIAMLYYSLVAREVGLAYEWDMTPISDKELARRYGITHHYQVLGRVPIE